MATIPAGVYNQEAVDRASVLFQARFDRLGDKQPAYKKWADEMDVGGAGVDIYIPEGLGQISEFRGSRRMSELRVEVLQARPKAFNTGWEVPLQTIMNDSALGLFPALAERAGQRARAFPDQLMARMLVKGFTDKGYDGVAFFSASHKKKGGTQSNIVTGGALNATRFRTALNLLRGRTDFAGLPLNLEAFAGKPVLMVPPELEETARGIVGFPGQTQVVSGTVNANWGQAEVQVNPYLAADVALDDEGTTSNGKRWFLGYQDPTMPAFLVTWRQRPNLTTVDSPDSEPVFKRRAVAYGVDALVAVDYLWWQVIVGSVGDT